MYPPVSDDVCPDICWFAVLCRFWLHCSHGLRRRSAYSRLLGLPVRISTGAWISLSAEFRVLSGSSICVESITRPEELYRLWCVWVWSWSLENEEALAHWGLQRYGEKSPLHDMRFCRVFLIKHRDTDTLHRLEVFAKKCWGICLDLGGVWSSSSSNNNNNYYYYYNLLQLGCHPVAVVILHVYKIWTWLLINLSREGSMRSM